MKKKLKEIFTDKKMLSVADFMEYALYHPVNGYYMNQHKKIGRSGDFLTSPKVSPVFAKLIARYCLDHWKNGEAELRFMEIACGDGAFASQFLYFLREMDEEISRNLKYIGIEKSHFHQKLFRETVEFHSIELYPSIADIPSFKGIIFSNEWLDAFPVRIIENCGEEMQEIMLRLDGDEIKEVKINRVDEPITEYLQEYSLEPQQGERIEVSIAMEREFKDLMRKLEKGILLTIDYGDLDGNCGKRGSLRGFKSHHLVDDYYKYPGEMDITYNVPFHVLRKIGLNAGAKELLFQRQDEFLMEQGVYGELKSCTSPDPFSAEKKWNRKIMQLMEGSGMSRMFHVLAQQK
ncbi:SAM-dependent methyltransferase [Falsibacillus pallidus]|uniref:SAM-dependent MidA family methyltransferase n=1 Tax=Falsibacillus pallidus TaxID=493781 RepID=A0A370GJV2_9BACI|nr:SAM-dependent methyltransferase [Falsibacillus pallidus]RDI43941.1 SAM-dependent MidA family methyltransferase [Falsibacillus pallidus]